MELILGALVSVVAQVSKKFFGTSEYATLATVAGLSLASAGVYTWLGSSGYWESTQQILITSGAFYAFVIARFPKAGNTPPVE